MLDEESVKFERYQALLGGEMIGIVLGAGIVLLCAGNPYVGLLFVLFWLAFHLTARKAIRG